ncbi:MAG: hemerythrin domain-containing protein [Pseudomonadota bacterium]
MPIYLIEPTGSAAQKLGQSLTQFRQHHRLKMKLCDALEDFADCLPNQIDVQNCLALSRCVLPTVRNAQLMEETQLFPQLMQAYPDDRRLQDSLDRLRQEHLEDDSFADEIACLLHDCGCTGKPSNAESAGYMLRGFFSSIRRHVAFENECLIPLIEHQTRVNGQSTQDQRHPG